MLAPGDRVGAFEITGPLGAGGMGAVFRARDTRLNRAVAIKVLPDANQDADRLARLRREAQALAALRHPHIATIHGLEELPGGAIAIVMELVEGEDLAAIMSRGALPIAEAVPLARQIADALESAHDRGIVHRDLKPGNIRVAAEPSGPVAKLLDFGLAKSADDLAGGDFSRVSHSPTFTAAGVTGAGVILGTAAYMSPEQARGRAVDRRADIWAFGVIVFEMLAGGPLFASDNVGDTLAAVLRQDIDWTRLPAATPKRLRYLIERCLDRDPRRRLRDIGEARVVLDGPLSAEEAASAVAPPAAKTSRGLSLAAASAALVGGVALGLFGARWQSAAPPEDRPTRTFALALQNRDVDDTQAISPDGRWLAFTTSGSLWLREMETGAVTQVADTAAAVRPFWSPASDAVGFAARNVLYKVAVPGGRPVRLASFEGGFTGASWSASKGIVFTASQGNWKGEVMSVAPDGGQPKPFARPDEAQGERRLYDPHFLPDGEAILFAAVDAATNDGKLVLVRHGVHTHPPAGPGAEAPAYADGQIVFSRGASSGLAAELWAIPYALDDGAGVGEARRIAESSHLASIARDGTLVYSQRAPVPQQLVWVNRGGAVGPTVGPSFAGRISGVALSPDASRVAMVVTTVEGDALHVVDVTRGMTSPIKGDFNAPAWTPDGRDVFYVNPTTGEPYRRPSDGGGEARRIMNRPAFMPDVSLDGRYLVFYGLESATQRDVFAAALDKPTDVLSVVKSPANDVNPAISPDGAWLAYQSDQAGRWEVYLTRFPSGEGRTQVSVNGGRNPRWSRNGRELFFAVGDDIVSTPVTLGTTVSVGTPVVVVRGSMVNTELSPPGILEKSWDVNADGTRFVVAKGYGKGTSDVVVVENAFPRKR